jgi:hypothetical protein
MTGNFSLVILTPHSRLLVIVTQHLEKLLSVHLLKLNTCPNVLPLLAAELLFAMAPKLRQYLQFGKL